MTRQGRLCWLILALGLASRPSGGLIVVVGGSDASFVDRTPLIVEATVLDQDPAPFNDPLVFSRTYRLAITRRLKGEVTSQIRVRIPGGASLNLLSYENLAVPVLTPGDRLLLFLEPVIGTIHRPRQLGLGVFRRIESSAGTWARGDVLGDERRDWQRFADWIADRAAGAERPADYWRGPATLSPPLRRSFLFDADLARPVTVFEQRGFDGLGGGLDALAEAADSWNQEPDSNIRLEVLSVDDPGQANLIFEDLRGDLGLVFDCATDEPQVLAAGVRTLAGNAVLLPGLFKGLLWESTDEVTTVFSRGSRCYFERHPDRLAQVMAAVLGAIPLGLTPSATVTGALVSLPLSERPDVAPGEAGPLDAAVAAFAYGDGAPIPPLPDPPAGLEASRDADGALRLSWDDEAEGESEQIVERQEADPPSGVDPGFVEIARPPADAETWRVENLPVGRLFRFRVRATNIAGTSAPSNVVEYSTEIPFPPSTRWLRSQQLPGIEMQVHFGLGASAREGTLPTPGDCPARTLCAAGARKDRAEILVRPLDGVEPGEWVAVAKFSSLPARLWIRRVGDAQSSFHQLPSATPGAGRLPGLLAPWPPAPAKQRLVTPDGGRPGEADAPPIADGRWLSTPTVPGFSFKARFGASAGRANATVSVPCAPDTICLARKTAAGGGGELFVRLLKERSGNFQLRAVRLAREPIAFWVRHDKSGLVRAFWLDPVAAQDTDLAGVLALGVFSP